MTDTPETPQAPESAIQQPAQAQTVTVPVDQPKEEQELLAGKFKSTDDLVKAYKELESKLGQQQPQQPAEQQQQQQTPQEQTDTTEESKPETKEGEGDDDPYAAYGEAVGNALKAAEVDPVAAQQEFAETGTLSDETFDKFAKAGFPKEMVEAYLRGVAQAAEDVTQITETQITQIKAVAGGDEGFGKLQSWMASNLSADELQAYNATLDSGDFTAILSAVSAMNARFQQDVGREGNLRSGRAAAEAPGYASEAEWLEDMRKPEYKTSQAFRDQVAAKLAKSPNILITR